MAKQVTDKTAAGIGASGKPRQHSLVWLQGLLCGAMVTLATPTALLLGVLLGPTILALVLDGQPGRPKARGVALFNMAAAVDPLRTLWVSGHSMSNATALLGDMHVLATAWSAAAAGWLLAELAPIAVRAVLDVLSVARVARLRAERTRLMEDWGFGSTDGDQ
jgi:hypothetical protein